MNRMNIYLTQDGQKIIKKIDKIRGNQSKSEFILQSVQYMIDTHKLNNNILNISEDQEGSITTAETKDTIRTDVFSHANKLKDRTSKATH